MPRARRKKSTPNYVRAITEAYRLSGHTGTAQPPIPRGQIPSTTYEVLGTKLGRRMNNLAAKDTKHRVGEQEAAALINAGITLREHGDGTRSIDPTTPKTSQLNKQIKDYTNALIVIEAYGLPGHTGTAQPPIPHGQIPNTTYEVLGTKLGQRMNDLAAKDTKSRVGPQEAAALINAGITLHQHNDGTRSIHPTTPRASQLEKQITDYANANVVIEAYGLPGHTGTAQPPILHGHLPNTTYEVLGTKLGQRMNDLARKETKSRVGPQEAAALINAGITLRQHNDGTTSIDPTTPRASQLDKQITDYANANVVIEAYQLPGHTGTAQPPIPRGHLPSQTYEVLGTKLGKRMHHLAAKDTDSRVGPQEATALINAGITLRAHSDGTWSIHPDVDRLHPRREPRAAQNATTGPAVTETATTDPSTQPTLDNPYAGTAWAYLPELHQNHTPSPQPAIPTHTTANSTSTHRNR
ncbi:hypothetical protein ACJ6WF_17860 [Streptomyces sp. MMS24-I2-30]|uniref:hypothetical protein n=1 Tax=Streptomyces sp. MMS24-I2-30 TaxID=3351564 RepID=UPI003896B4BA